MKIFFYLMVIVTCYIFLISANKKESFNPKKVGLQHVGNTKLWVDENEVSVLDYEEMMYSVNNGNYTPKTPKESLHIDISKIPNAMCVKTDDKSLIPLLGVTREIAEEYCRFRTWAISKSFEGKLPKGSFRLLTEDEAKTVIGNDPENINCILPIEKSPKKVKNLSNNADELLANGKVIQGFNFVKDSDSNPALTGFRCCLEY